MRTMDLTRDPLPGLMWRIAVPGATGLFLQTVLNLTDTWFAGQISTLAQAALSLSFPLFFVLGTFGVGLATGASSLVARALGGGDRETARCMAGQALLLGLVLSLALAVSGRLITRPAFISMGAEGEYLEMCLAYMNTIFLFAPVMIMLQVANALLVAQGDSQGLRNALGVGVVLNVPLDWWLMNGGLGLPALGVTGLALATVVVQVGSLIYLAGRIRRGGLFEGGFRAALRPRWGLQRELWSQAVPPALNQASVGLGIYVINWFVGRFGAEAVAAYGVAVRLEQLILLPGLGLSIAMLPLTAQNDAAGRFERAAEARRLALRWGALVSSVALVVLFGGGYWLMGLVSPDPGVRSEGAWFLKFDASAFFAYLVLYINVAFLQGLKRPMFALWIGLYRQIVAPVLVFWLLAFVLGWGTTGIWLGIALVTASGAVIAELYTRRVLKRRRACAATWKPGSKADNDDC